VLCRIQAFGKRDADDSAAMYAPEAALMTNMSLVKGTDNIRPILKEIMAAPNFSMSFKRDKGSKRRSQETL